MLNFGMLEWIINLLEQRHSAYAVEYGMGIAINLAQNVIIFLKNIELSDVMQIVIRDCS